MIYIIYISMYSSSMIVPAMDLHSLWGSSSPMWSCSSGNSLATLWNGAYMVIPKNINTVGDGIHNVEYIPNNLYLFPGFCSSIICLEKQLLFFSGLLGGTKKQTSFLFPSRRGFPCVLVGYHPTSSEVQSFTTSWRALRHHSPNQPIGTVHQTWGRLLLLNDVLFSSSLVDPRINHPEYDLNESYEPSKYKGLLLLGLPHVTALLIRLILSKHI